MTRSKRSLTENEQELWNKVIKQVETIEAMPPLIIATKIKRTKAIKTETPLEIKPFKIGTKVKVKPTIHAPLSLTSRPSQTSPNMDRRSFQRLLKGKLEIDATLDLHGFTADQARSQLQIFIQNANRRGNRLLLIITGKGNKETIDEFGRIRSGILRSGVPEWLKQSDEVLQVTQAHGKHGGSGAYYVYLRRKRC